MKRRTEDHWRGIIYGGMPLRFLSTKKIKGTMTIDELKKVPFRETCHMAMEGEYTTTYMSNDGRLGFCDHVPRDEYGMMKKGGRAVRHFMIDGKVYKSKKKFLEAIKDFNPNALPINH